MQMTWNNRHRQIVPKPPYKLHESFQGTEIYLWGTAGPACLKVGHKKNQNELKKLKRPRPKTYNAIVKTGRDARKQSQVFKVNTWKHEKNEACWANGET